MLEKAHVANKVFHLISQSIHRAAGFLCRLGGGFQRDQINRDTHSRGQYRGHKIPTGTCFFQCSLIVKVHPPEREVGSGGSGGTREAILTPQQKVNKFILNDWSSESWDKGSPAETGCSGVTGCIHSSVPCWEKPKVGFGLGGKEKNSKKNSTFSVPELILPHCVNYCPETENCSFLGAAPG